MAIAIAYYRRRQGCRGGGRHLFGPVRGHANRQLECALSSRVLPGRNITRWGLTWTHPQAAGRERAMRFLLEQPIRSAGEALALGIVVKVCEASSLEERFVEHCGQIADMAAIVARQTNFQRREPEFHGR